MTANVGSVPTLDTNHHLKTKHIDVPAAALVGTPSSATATALQTLIAAAVTAAVNALLNGAPDALNTLKELADALGDDTSFATTVTTALNARYLKTEADARFATFLTPTAVKTAPYTAAALDLVPVDATSAAVAITLPTAPADKTRISVKKIDASVNAVTVQRGGSSDVFNKASGTTSVALALTNQSLTIQYQASTGIWYVVDGDLPYSSLAASLSATSVTLWKSNTAYATGQSVLNPSGFVVTAITGFTSGSSYNAANWSDAAGSTYVTHDQSVTDAIIYGG
jgi:hypothetical protein